MAIKFDSIPLIGDKSVLPRKYQNGVAVISEFNDDKTLYIPIGNDLSPGYNAVGTFYVITNSGNNSTKPNLNLSRLIGQITDAATGNVMDSIQLAFGDSIIIGMEDKGQDFATAITFSGSGTGDQYVLPIATEQILGGIKSGSDIGVSADGSVTVKGIQQESNIVVNSISANEISSQTLNITSNGKIIASESYNPDEDSSLVTKKWVESYSPPVQRVIQELDIDNSENKSKLWLSQQNTSSGQGTAPAFGTPESQYLQIGGSETGAETVRGIGLGYAYSSNGLGNADSISPAFIGFQETDSSGDTLGDIIIATRDTTAKGAVPSERLRITSQGDIQAGELYTPSSKTSIATKDYVDNKIPPLNFVVNPPKPETGAAIRGGTYLYNDNATEFELVLGLKSSGGRLYVSNKSSKDVTLTGEGGALFSTDGYNQATESLIINPGDYKIMAQSGTVWIALN